MKSEVASNKKSMRQKNTEKSRIFIYFQIEEDEVKTSFNFNILS